MRWAIVDDMGAFTVAIISPMPLEPPVTRTTRSLTLKSASISMILKREKEKSNNVGKGAVGD